MQLQRMVGNRAVSKLVAGQRRMRHEGQVPRSLQRCGCGCVIGCTGHDDDGGASQHSNLQARGAQPSANNGATSTNDAIQRLLGGHTLDRRAPEEEIATIELAGSSLLSRQTVASPSGPTGSDPCSDILQAIIDLLNEVAQRFNDALNDPHDLFRNHRWKQDAHPDYGSWEGHEDRYNYDRDRLRHKLSQWESNDDCRGYPLSRQQQEDMQEAQEFRNTDYPERPAPSMSQSHQEEGESVWDKLRRYLPEILVTALIAIGAAAAAAAIVACFASGACEFAAALAGLGILVAAGITAALRAAGVRDEPSGGPVASGDAYQSNDGAVA
jgi:hypothetical protein